MIIKLKTTLAPAFGLLLVGAFHTSGQIISDVSPPLGSPGDAVIIWGSGFAPGGSPPSTIQVHFNTTLATTNPNVVLSDNQINVTVPIGATTGQVRVRINNGVTANSPQSFLIIGPGPYATNFTPVFGPSSGGTPVTINGVHFDTVTNVSFNGKLGTGFNGAAINQIQINSPNGVTSGPLILMSSNPSRNFSTATNTMSAATNFFVPPIIKGFAPGNGRPSTNVTISGTNFIGATAVTFANVGASFTVINNTTIQAVVPANAPSGPVRVTVPFVAPDVTITNFRMLPTFSSFSPTTGGAGTPVVITGANLNETSLGRADVFFNGAQVTTYTATSASSLTVNVPNGATSGHIWVTTTNGSMTNAVVFHVPPSISGFSPTNSPPGSRVTITGANFTNASSVSFNGVPVPAGTFTVTNNTTMGVTVPNGVTTGPISVTTPAGTATSSGIFYAAPIIFDFNPKSGLPGTNVTITGTNFLGTTAVRFFNNVAATTNTISNGQITVVVPNGAQTGPITIVAPGGTTNTAADFVLNNTNNLVLGMSDLPDPVFVGSNLVYTIGVTNLGPVDAPNVRLTNTLSSSVQIRAATTTAGILVTNTSPVVIGTISSLPSGSTAVIQLTVAPQVAGAITNFAAVVSDYPDSVPANNSNSVTTTVWPLPLLSIQLLTNDLVQVSWPAPLSNFTLQFKSELSTNTAWSNLVSPRTITSSNVFVTETNLDFTRFYRLTN